MEFSVFLKIITALIILVIILYFVMNVVGSDIMAIFTKIAELLW